MTAKLAASSAWLTAIIRLCGNDMVLRTAWRSSAAVIFCSVRGRPARTGSSRRAIGRIEINRAA